MEIELRNSHIAKKNLERPAAVQRAGGSRANVGFRRKEQELARDIRQQRSPIFINRNRDGKRGYVGHAAYIKIGHGNNSCFVNLARKAIGARAE
jgi:hypothetical protein